MTRPATPSPLTRATEALRAAEQAREATAIVIARNAKVGVSRYLLSRFDREDAAVEYARAVRTVEFIKAAQEVAA